MQTPDSNKQKLSLRNKFFTSNQLLLSPVFEPGFGSQALFLNEKKQCGNQDWLSTLFLEKNIIF